MTHAPDFPTRLSERRSARAGGILYLVTFVSSIPAVLLLGPILDNSRYVLSGGSDTRVVLGCVLDIVNALACVGTAVALYPAVKRRAETLAIGFLASRLIEAAVILIGVMCLLGVVSLRHDVAGVSEGDASLVTVARALVAVRDWTFLLGPTLMSCINALFLATALRQARLVPRVIPTLGLIGAPILMLSTIVAVFRHNEVVAPLALIGVAPIFVWELALGLWLSIRGFLPTAELAEVR